MCVKSSTLCFSNKLALANTDIVDIMLGEFSASCSKLMKCAETIVFYKTHQQVLPKCGDGDKSDRQKTKHAAVGG